MVESNLTKSKYMSQLTSAENYRECSLLKEEKNRIKFVLKDNIEVAMRKLLHQQNFLKITQPQTKINIFEILDIADEVIQDRRELEKERADHEKSE